MGNTQPTESTSAYADTTPAFTVVSTVYGNDVTTDDGLGLDEESGSGETTSTTSATTTTTTPLPLTQAATTVAPAETTTTALPPTTTDTTMPPTTTTTTLPPMTTTTTLAPTTTTTTLPPTTTATTTTMPPNTTAQMGSTTTVKPGEIEVLPGYTLSDLIMTVFLVATVAVIVALVLYVVWSRKKRRQLLEKRERDKEAGAERRVSEAEVDRDEKWAQNRAEVVYSNTSTKRKRRGLSNFRARAISPERVPSPSSVSSLNSTRSTVISKDIDASSISAYSVTDEGSNPVGPPDNVHARQDTPANVHARVGTPGAAGERPPSRSILYQADPTEVEELDIRPVTAEHVARQERLSASLRDNKSNV